MATFVYPAQSVSIAGGATEAKQDDIILELQQIEAEVADVATETTLSTIDGKITTVDTSNVTVSSSALPTGAATEATLSAIDGKITTVDTGDVTVSSSALPTGAATETTLGTLATESSLSAQAADIALLEDRLAGSLVPEQYDYIALTYVAAGNGAGEIETVEYRDGGSGGTLVATLTLTYDGSDRLATVTRS